tara:strand:+ start:107 stop:307 length:201 start_codon:yes stop_codon:yes gene_type:complete
MEHILDRSMINKHVKEQVKMKMNYYNDVYNKCLLLPEEKKQYLSKGCDEFLKKYEYYKRLNKKITG